MKKNLIYSLVGFICVTTGLLCTWPHKTTRHTVAQKRAIVLPTTVLRRMLIKHAQDDTSLKKVSFAHLPGWHKAKITKSLAAFQLSCKTFLKQDPEHPVGSQFIDLQAKDWHPACQAALTINARSEDAARLFFETWFHPVKFFQPEPIGGLFTGYYMPDIPGSLTKTKTYSIPLYGLPDELAESGKKPKPSSYYTRAEIDSGVLDNKAPVIAWIHSAVDRLFLEIEGGGIIQLANGKRLYVGYAGENGAPYTSVVGVLIKMGIMTKDNASKTAVKQYLANHPEQINTVLHQNKSFVFFESLKQSSVLGAQGIALTPGYSLAIDRKWIPLGAPLWLTTKKPTPQSDSSKTFQRLMIAQDTGGAIRGVIRGDVYWGAGKKASYLGEHMKNEGHYWLLLPKHRLDSIAYAPTDNYLNTIDPFIQLINKQLSIMAQSTSWTDLSQHIKQHLAVVFAFIDIIKPAAIIPQLLAQHPYYPFSAIAYDNLTLFNISLPDNFIQRNACRHRNIQTFNPTQHG